MFAKNSKCYIISFILATLFSSVAFAKDPSNQIDNGILSGLSDNEIIKLVNGNSELIFKNSFELLPTAENFIEDALGRELTPIILLPHVENADEFELMGYTEEGDVYCYSAVNTRVVMLLNDTCGLNDVKYEVTDGPGFFGTDSFLYRVNSLYGSSLIYSVVMPNVLDR